MSRIYIPQLFLLIRIEIRYKNALFSFPSRIEYDPHLDPQLYTSAPFQRQHHYHNYHQARRHSP